MACVANPARQLCLKSTMLKCSTVVLPSKFARQISGTTSLYCRRIKQSTEGNLTVIEGEKIESDRKGRVIPIEKPEGGCTLCGFDVKYTDVLILSQFVKSNGGILPRWTTGLCEYQQRKMIVNLHKAQRAGLMPNLRPPREDGKIRPSNMSAYKWKKYNVYFEKDDKVFVESQWK